MDAKKNGENHQMDTEKALRWITEALGVQDRVVTLDDTRNSLAEWDSLGSLLLLSKLEEDHNVLISADDIVAINSVKEICELLEKANAFRAG
jgi:acyl carrier protein